MVLPTVTVPVRVGLERVTPGIGLGKYGLLIWVVVPLPEAMVMPGAEIVTLVGELMVRSVADVMELPTVTVPVVVSGPLTVTDGAVTAPPTPSTPFRDEAPLTVSEP